MKYTKKYIKIKNISLAIINTIIISGIIFFINNKQVKAYYDKNPFLDNGLTLQSFGSVDLSDSWDQKRFKQEDGSFLFSGPIGPGSTVEWYDSIKGSKGDDTLVFRGYFEFSNFDLGQGTNTVTFEEGSIILAANSALDPNNPDASANVYQNVNVINVQKDVQIEAMKVAYKTDGSNITINLAGGDPTLQQDIIFGQLAFIGGNPNVGEGVINVSGEVDVMQDIDLSAHNETINLADGKLATDGTIDKSSTSVLDVVSGINSLGGNNTINMGKFSTLKTTNGSVTLGNGNNTVNLSEGSSFLTALVLGDGNNVVNVASLGDNINNTDYKITINTINMGRGNNTINIENNSNFVVTNSINFGTGNNRLIINDGSIFTVSGTAAYNVIFDGGSNYVYMGKNSTTNANIKFNGSNDNVLVDLDDNATTNFNGSITGSNKNDSLSLQGNGVLQFNNSVDTALEGVNNINFDNARINFMYLYRQDQDVNYKVKINKDNSAETDARIGFNSGVQFNDHSINLTFAGQSQYLNKVGDQYSFQLLRDGTKGNTIPLFTNFDDIGLSGVNFNSAVYSIDNNVSNNTLNTTLTKCSTFKDAVSGYGLCDNTKTKSANANVVSVAGMLDQLTVQTDLPSNYYDLLDKLSMMNLSDLENAIAGFSPINNQVLLQINQQVAQSFKSTIFNGNPYKLQKGNMSIWSQYAYSNLTLDDTDENEGSNNNINTLLLGADYTLTNNIKVGVTGGLSQTGITSNENNYSGDVNGVYYGLYSFVQLTNNLLLRLNAATMYGKFDLKRHSNVIDGDIGVKPRYLQSSGDGMLEYKIKMDDFVVTPFVSLGYSKAKISQYQEDSATPFTVEGTYASFFNTSFGASVVTMVMVNDHVVVPSFRAALNIKSNSFNDTVAYLADLKDSSSPINFTASDYGKVVAELNGGLSYFITNSSIIAANVGYSKGDKLSEYNIILSFNYHF
ncbi:autotransporter domain-containing protein [Rickettsiales bacterium LUAb2]